VDDGDLCSIFLLRAAHLCLLAGLIFGWFRSDKVL
jgi:hypothetical protein